jgi:hypothetical protein
MPPFRVASLRLAFVLCLGLAAGVGAAIWAGQPAEEPATGTRHSLVLAGDLAPPARLRAGDVVIDTGEAWGHSGPCFHDVDGDGRPDLVVGDFSGKFRFYRNIGSREEPRFDPGTFLQAGGVDAQVPIY